MEVQPSTCDGADKTFFISSIGKKEERREERERERERERKKKKERIIVADGL